MSTLQLIATIANGIVAILCVAILIRQQKIMRYWKKYLNDRDGNHGKTNS